MKTNLLGLLLLVAVHCGFAQENPDFFGFKGYYGFIISHSEEVKSISQTNPFGFQLEYSRLKTSDKAWKTCHCYGRSGLSFAYFNYNNPDVLGSSYNLIYFVEPYFTFKGPLKFSVRGGAGVTYLDKVYDAESNPKNLLFSSNFNFYLGLSLNLNYHLNNNYAINLSANYSHISNGSSKQPNKGMNFPTVSIGIDRTLNYEGLEAKPQELKDNDMSSRYYVGSFFSLRSAGEDEESTSHPLIGLTGGTLIPLTGINGINGGVELWYNWADKETANLEMLDDSVFISSVIAGHHFKLGNFYALQQFGVYVTRPKEIQSNAVYQRYSFWYGIGRSKRWTLGASMLMHGTDTDFIDGRLLFIVN